MTAEDLDDMPDDVDELEPRPVSWSYLAGVLVCAVGNLARTVATAADEVAGELARHAQWSREVDDGRQFASAVMRDIETIPATAERAG